LIKTQEGGIFVASSRYLVCLAPDLAAASRTGLHTVDLSYTLGENGELTRPMFSPARAGLLGISDRSLKGPVKDEEKLYKDLLAEYRKREASGLLFDFEGRDQNLYPFFARLSARLAEDNIPHLVPERFSMAAPRARVMVEAAVSGGRFDDFYEEAARRHGADRLSFFLRPICADFSIPSLNAEGTPLSPDQLAALMDQYAPSIFFSPDLKTKYFSYGDKEGHYHFVLMDDRTTMDEKLRFLESRCEGPIFLLYNHYLQYWAAPRS